MSYDLPETLSPSSIATWQQCPLRFKYSKIDKIREPDTEASVLGNFVHEVLEIMYQFQDDHRQLKTAKHLMTDLWHEKWKKKWQNSAKQKLTESEIKWQAWWAIENCFELEDPKEIDVGGVEVELKSDIEGVPIFGILDRWDNRNDDVVIVDYKTGKKPYGEYTETPRRQLMIYSLTAADVLETEIKSAELLYLKSGERVSYDVTDDLLGETKEVVKDTWNEIQVACESEEFETRTGPLCNWCFYQPDCPAWN